MNTKNIEICTFYVKTQLERPEKNLRRNLKSLKDKIQCYLKYIKNRKIAKESMSPICYKSIQRAFRKGKITTKIIHNFYMLKMLWNQHTHQKKKKKQKYH